MRILGIGSKSDISAMTAVGMTETGKKVAERYESYGPKFSILSALTERSPQTLKELADETQVDMTELKERIKQLSKQGLVRIIGGGE